MTKTDRTLEQFRSEWEKSHKKITLQKAVLYCKKRRVPYPAWLHGAIYGLGLALVMSVERVGRARDWAWYKVLHDNVEELRSQGLTLEDACQQTAIDFKMKVTRGKNKGGDADSTVMTAWRVWRKNTVEVDPSKLVGTGLEEAYEKWWRELKPEVIARDRDAKALANGEKPRRDKFNDWYLKQPLTDEEYYDLVKDELYDSQIIAYDEYLRPIIRPLTKEERDENKRLLKSIEPRVKNK